MPTIPLIRGGETVKTLAQLPTPQLDNLRRPTVDNRGVIAGIGAVGRSARMPLMNPRVAAEPFDALGSVGQSIMRAGGVVGAVAEQREKAKSYHQVHAATMEMEAQEQALREKMDLPENRNNPDALEPLRQETFNAMRQRVGDNEDLTPMARDAINMNLEEWNAKTKAATYKESSKMHFDMAREANEVDWNQAMVKGNKERAEEITRYGISQGYIYPAAATEREERFKAHAAKVKDADTRAAVVNEASMNIGSARGFLEKYPDAGAFDGDPEHWRSGVSAAKFTIGLNTQAAAEEVGALIINKPLATDKDIEEAAAGRLSDTALAAAKSDLKKRQQDKWQAENFSELGVAKNYGALLIEVNNFKGTQGDPKADAAYAKLHWRIKTLLPEGLAGKVSVPLSRKYTGGDGPEAPAPTKDFVKDQLTSWYDQQKFGTYKERVPYKPDEPGYDDLRPEKRKEVENPTRRDEARLAMGMAAIHMEKWLDDHPAASLPEVKREMMLSSGAHLSEGEVNDYLRKPAPAAPTIDFGALIERIQPPKPANAEAEAAEAEARRRQFQDIGLPDRAGGREGASNSLLPDIPFGE